MGKTLRRYESDSPEMTGTKQFREDLKNLVNSASREHEPVVVLAILANLCGHVCGTFIQAGAQRREVHLVYTKNFETGLHESLLAGMQVAGHA